jgi:dsDNA-binding SOS-regulon protein
MKKIKNPENKCAHLKILNKDPNNKFEVMLKKQKELQDALGNSIDDLNDKQKVQMFKEMLICLMAENIEALDRLPWKIWRNYDTYKLSKEEFLEFEFEICDCFFFFMNMLLIFKIDAKRLYNLYISKQKENLDRIKRGYSKGK